MTINAYEEYMRQVTEGMRVELRNAGFEELVSNEEVTTFMAETSGTTFVVINSVCGCAAGLARPAAIQAVMNSEKKPTNLVTVFAGQEKEATATMRSYFEGIEPSSPSMALLKGTEVVHFIPREHIEDHTAEEIMQNIMSAFAANC